MEMNGRLGTDGSDQTRGGGGGGGGGGMEWRMEWNEEWIGMNGRNEWKKNGTGRNEWNTMDRPIKEWKPMEAPGRNILGHHSRNGGNAILCFNLTIAS